MKRLSRTQSLRAVIITACLVAASVRTAAADSLTVQWDLNTEPEVTGYVVHVGSQPGAYTQTFDVGNTDTFTLNTAVAGQRYCFAVTAQAGAQSSGFSNEVCGYSNMYPTLQALSNQSTVAGTSLFMQLVGADPDGTPVTYAATGLPTGLSLNATTGLIAGTPTTAGSYNVTATVSDGTLSATRSFTWTITSANVAPTLTAVSNQSGTVGVAASLQLFGDDVNGDQLTYSATGLPGGLSVT